MSALFLLSQIPFALGAILLALASYPDAINRATVLGQVSFALLLLPLLLPPLLYHHHHLLHQVEPAPCSISL